MGMGRLVWPTIFRKVVIKDQPAQSCSCQI